MVHGGDYLLRAKATSKLEVAYEIAGDTSAARIDGSKLTILKAAPFKVTARQPGDTKWAAATPVERSAKPAKRPQRVALSVAGKREVGETLQIKITINSELTPELKSSNEEVLRLGELENLGNGVWSAQAEILERGRASIIASQPGDDNHRKSRVARRAIAVTT